MLQVIWRYTAGSCSLWKHRVLACFILSTPAMCLRPALPTLYLTAEATACLVVRNMCCLTL